MINVLFITDKIRQRSGITSVIMNYLEHMPKENVKIDLIVYEESEESQIKRAKSYGANVWFMPELGLKSVSKFCSYMNSFFRNHHYDIVHSHFNQIDGLVFPIARKHGVTCCISHSHNTKLSDNAIKEVRNRIMCWNIGQNADILAACSEKAGVFLYGQSFKKSKRKLLINNGIDVKEFVYNSELRKKIRSECFINDDELLMGHVGRFEPQKNHEYIIEIFKTLCEKQMKAKLMLVGDGDLRGTIERKVKEYGIEDRVIFTGVRHDVNHVLSALDLFIFPSVYEGLGIALIEAQCSGLICFASNTVPHEVNITGNVSFLPINRDIDMWVDAISKVTPIVESDRYAYANMVEKNGYDIVEEAKKLEKIYMEAAMI